MAAIRLALFVGAFLVLAWPAFAQDPLVDVQFEENKAIPGQSLTLRITILVPTWLPKPVVFPTFEAPNVLVRLPEKATSPTSRSVDGETWSGVTRRIEITPMVPGQFQIPEQELIVTWAEPGQTEPLQKSVPLEPIVVEGLLPEGAEDLDPFVAAEALSLERSLSEVQMPMGAGDSLTFTVTAKLDGSSAMFLPRLIPPIQIESVAAYPAEPVITDSENRGVISGTRTETVSLVAERGGAGNVPDVVLRWYNLKSGDVEEARAEGFDITVDAPASARDPIPVRLIALYLALALLAGGLVWLFWRFAAPPLRSFRDARRRRKLASEQWAYAALRRAIDTRDMGHMMQALDLWAARCALDPRDTEPLKSALSALGLARYGPEKSQEDGAWRNLKAAVADTRNRVRPTQHALADLPPLNPTNQLSARPLP